VTIRAALAASSLGVGLLMSGCSDDGTAPTPRADHSGKNARTTPSSERPSTQHRVIPKGQIVCRALKKPGAGVDPQFTDRWTVPEGGAARCVTVPRRNNGDLVVFMTTTGRAVVVDLSIGEHESGYATSFGVPTVANVRSADIHLKDWTTLVMGGRSVDITKWLT
jgi:hypothetical protein